MSTISHGLLSGMAAKSWKILWKTPIQQVTERLKPLSSPITNSNSVTLSYFSGETRDTELCIKANLVDPSVAWALKNIYLLRYHAALASLFQQDQRLFTPPTTEPLHPVSLATLSHDDVIVQYFEDRDAGL